MRGGGGGGGSRRRNQKSCLNRVHNIKFVALFSAAWRVVRAGRRPPSNFVSLIPDLLEEREHRPTSLLRESGKKLDQF